MRYKIEFESVRAKKKDYVCILTREIWINEKNERHKMSNFKYVVLQKEHIIYTGFVSFGGELNLQKQAEKELDHTIKDHLRRMELL